MTSDAIWACFQDIAGELSLLGHESDNIAFVVACLARTWVPGTHEIPAKLYSDVAVHTAHLSSRSGTTFIYSSTQYHPLPGFISFFTELWATMLPFPTKTTDDTAIR